MQTSFNTRRVVFPDCGQLFSSCFIYISLHFAIQNCIAIWLKNFLIENTVSYIYKYCTFTHPALVSLNIHHKLYTNTTLRQFIHYSSWRLVPHQMIAKIVFWNAICTKSCCNTIFPDKMHCKYQEQKPSFNTLIKQPPRILLK